MKTLKANSKEILISYGIKGFKIDSRGDYKYLSEYMEIEEFESILEEFSKHADMIILKKFYNITRIIKFVLFSLSVLLLVTIIVVFNLSMFSVLDLMSEPVLISTYSTIILIIILIGVTVYMELFVLRAKKIAFFNKLNSKIEENFFNSQFMINNVNGGLSFLLRVVQYNTEKPSYETMDYYDYLNYHNPESDDFYKQWDPFNYDPYEMKLNVKELDQF